MLEVIDFLERLAPLSEPKLLARDERPIRSADTPIDILATLARHAPKSQGIVMDEDEDYEDEAPATSAALPGRAFAPTTVAAGSSIPAPAAAGSSSDSSAPAGGGYDALKALRQSLGRE
jgi:hypothetical protein